MGRKLSILFQEACFCEPWALATVRCENRALAVVAKIDKRDKTIKTPTLIIQGGRDTFGNMAEVSAYELSPSIDVR